MIPPYRALLSIARVVWREENNTNSRRGSTIFSHNAHTPTHTTTDSGASHTATRFLLVMFREDFPHAGREQGKRRHTHNGSTSWCKREVGEKGNALHAPPTGLDKRLPHFSQIRCVFDGVSLTSLFRENETRRETRSEARFTKRTEEVPRAGRPFSRAAPERLRKRGLNSTAHAPFSWG